MSNYSAPTRHPVTGVIEMADWLDDHDGKHRYGVRFPSDGKIYGGKECVEVKPREMLKGHFAMMDIIIWMRDTAEENTTLRAEIEWLRAALLKISELEPEGPLGDDCMAVRYASETARAALTGEKTND